MATYDQIDNAIENNQIINVTPQGELLIDSPDSKLKQQIIEDIDECTTIEELRDIQARYQDSIQELMLYNIGCSKEILKAMCIKEDELYIESITETLQKCSDYESLEQIWGANKESIEKLKAREEKKITKIYTDLKQHFIDTSTP